MQCDVGCVEVSRKSTECQQRRLFLYHCMYHQGSKECLKQKEEEICEIQHNITKLAGAGQGKHIYDQQKMGNLCNEDKGK